MTKNEVIGGSFTILDIPNKTKCYKCKSNEIYFREVKKDCGCGAITHFEKKCLNCGKITIIHRYILEKESYGS